MPSKIVDLSARSAIIRDEPFYVHFWECSPKEFLSQLKNPRKFLTQMGVEIPANCRIETTIDAVVNAVTGDVGRRRRRPAQLHRTIAFLHDQV